MCIISATLYFLFLAKVPKDLLVAHAEKRVLQAALEQEAKNAADAKVQWEGLRMLCFVPIGMPTPSIIIRGTHNQVLIRGNIVNGDLS